MIFTLLSTSCLIKLQTLLTCCTWEETLISEMLNGTHQSLALLNNIQYACLKSLLLDTEASLLSLTEYFNSLDAEATPGCRLLDSFPKHISFHPCNHSSLNSCNTHLESLDRLCLEASSSPSTLVVVTDASVIPSRHMQAVPTAYI